MSVTHGVTALTPVMLGRFRAASLLFMQCCWGTEGSAGWALNWMQVKLG